MGKAASDVDDSKGDTQAVSGSISVNSKCFVHDKIVHTYVARHIAK